MSPSIGALAARGDPLPPWANHLGGLYRKHWVLLGNAVYKKISHGFMKSCFHEMVLQATTPNPLKPQTKDRCEGKLP